MGNESGGGLIREDEGVGWPPGWERKSEQVELIDANTRFGYDPRRGVMTTPEEIKQAGQRWGVTRAYTCSWTAVLFDCMEGNEKTLELCAADDFFRPVAVACPTGTYARVRVDTLRESGFAMVRLLPELHGYAVDSTACARLVEALAEGGMPVVLPTAGSEATRIAHLLRGRQGTFILTNNTYGVLGELLALADFLPSVFIELSGVFTPDGISVLRDAFTKNQLLWGSGYPLLNVGSSVMALRGSGLTRDEIQMVGAGNARRILEAGR